MAFIRKVILCPYCDTRIYLGDCPIVATNRIEDGGQFPGDDDYSPPSTTRLNPNATTWGRYPVLWMPPPPSPRPAPPPPSQGLVGQIFDALTNVPEGEEPDEYEVIRPVDQFGFPWRDLPARACVECAAPFPDDIGERRILKIGVVGTTGAGKSHFIAALLKQGAHQQGLRKWGVSEFDLDEVLRATYREVYEPFFHTGRALEPTNPALAHEARSHPLIVRATFSHGTEVLLFFYDIDGETLLDRGLRARYADYLHRPDGLIFLIDPMMIEAIRERLPPDPNYQAFIRQGDLVNACVTDLKERAYSIPIAITLSKSDLIGRAAKREFPFDEDSAKGDPLSARVKEMAKIHQEVKRVLGAAGQFDLLALTDRLGADAQITFHAVAPIGFAPRATRDGQVAAEIKPLRCLDPLVAVLAPWVREKIRSGA